MSSAHTADYSIWDIIWILWQESFKQW
jgi:hypothetical protein